MQDAEKYRVVLVTAPDIEVGRKLAHAALNAHLVACANILPQIESHYWWRGKLESGAEVLIVFKTSVERLELLEETILQNHPYDTPEIVALPIRSGTVKYLKWMEESLTTIGQ